MVENVVQAFEALDPEPEVIVVENGIDVPNEGGHLQGVQCVEVAGMQKLLVSGSSLTNSYMLQVDLQTRNVEKVIYLMPNPYRHAGGMQAGGDYIAVGIEDNHAKTFSKVCFYKFDDSNLGDLKPEIAIERKGDEKEKTAGATGLLAMDSNYLAVVSNWDSRNWDFYGITRNDIDYQILASFSAPGDWPSYQAINLIADAGAIYAIGFYTLADRAYADLIFVSELGDFNPVMKKVKTKAFFPQKGVDFNAAAGLQVDSKGDLHIWGTQRNAREVLVVNKFSKN